MAYAYVVLCQYYGDKVDEPQSYQTSEVPIDISSARQVLGYDKYEQSPVGHTQNANYLYGNNWEQFDNPDQYAQFGKYSLDSYKP